MAVSADVRVLDAGSVLIVIPSMTFDSTELAKIAGAMHFEERMLWLLQVLRDPDARVVYVTSQPLPARLIDYSASLTGRADAVERITQVSCDDPRPVALSRKVLRRSDIQASIRGAVGGSPSVMMCHVATEVEQRLADTLGAELFACPPALSSLGSKSASRRAFKAAGLPLPHGTEDVRARDEVVEALVGLCERRPGLGSAIVKLNESFAGGGNAIVDLPPRLSSDPHSELDSLLDSARFVAPDESSDRYLEALERMGGVVEEMIEGDGLTSPSAQCVIGSDGSVRVVSTHEQILGGADRQTFFGCRFPARDEYSIQIAESARRVAEYLGGQGVRGHLSVDFVCRPIDPGWEHYAIEVNLRMGGTTAPISFLESATGKFYDPATGRFPGPGGEALYYTSADRVQSDAYTRLDAASVLDEANRLSLHFDSSRGSGVIFFMLGALTTVGKLGIVAIDKSPELADALYDKTILTLDRLAARV